MKALRIVLAVLAGAIVLLFIAAVIIVRSFDLNDYKDEITAFVQERTGRTLAIDDDIEFSLFPWFAVETGGVSLGDDPAFADRSFVTVDSLSARVRVWPLLRRDIEVGRVILDGVNVNLGTDADGRGNWTTLLEAPAPEAPAAAPPDPERPLINTLAVEGIELRNARILWHDPNGEVAYLARDLTLVTGPVTDSEPVELSLSLSLLDVASQASAAIELEAVAALRPGLRLGDIVADVRLLDSRQQERGSATLGAGSFEIDGGVLRSGPAELDATLLGPPLGPDMLEIGASFASFELDTGMETLTVNGLAASAGELDASLSLAGTAMLSDPRLTGTMELRSASLAGLLETLGVDPPEDLAAADVPSAAGDGAGTGGFAATAGFEIGLVGRTVAADYTANLLGVEATGRASLAPDTGLGASIELAPFRPTEPLLALLEPRLPEGVDLRLISTVALGASLARSAGSNGLDVESFTIALDGARIEGRLSVDDIGAPAEIGGTLAASGLDNRLLAALFGAWLPAPLVDTPLGEFRLATSFAYEPPTKTAAFAPLELTAYGLSGDGELSVTGAGDSLALSGRATLAEFSPRELLARFELPVPQTSDPTALGSAELAASFETSGSRGEFRDIAIELDDSRITGELSVANFADPEYRFVLRADRIDADRYLPPRAAVAAEAAPAAAADAGEKRLGDMRLASEPLTATNVAGSASVGNLRIGDMDFEQLSTDVAFGGGRAALSSVRTELYGGSFAGGLTIDATGAPSAVRLTGDLGEVALEPLLTAMLGSASLRGTGNIDLELTGSGETINEALTSAAGSMSVAFTDGEINGMNIGHRLCSAVNSARGLPAPAAAPNATVYSVIRATATISDGIASTSDIYATTGYLDLTGQGGIRLVDQRIDTQHRATLTGAIPIAGCENVNGTISNDPVPFNFTLKGRLPDIEVGLDIGQLLQDLATRELRQGVRERLEDAILDRLRN